MHVLVGCSGGVDSMVSSVLLRRAYCEVSLSHLLMWCYDGKTYDEQVISEKKEDLCSSYSSSHHVFSLAKAFGMSFHTVDVRDVFFKNIVSTFMDGYCAGITPNPCVLCNKDIKFKTLYTQSLSLGCDHIATGHYANIGRHEKRYFVKKGVDSYKDQSYFLWSLPQEYLSKIIFPLGGWHKKDVIRYAYNNNLTSLCLKKESEDICFLPNCDYRCLLHHYRKEEMTSLQGGDFILGGKVVGKHQGYPFYTIGQRKGLGLALGFPVFVQQIDPCSNTVFLCREEKLWTDSMLVTDINFQKYTTIEDGLICRVKIRYNSAEKECAVTWVDDKTVRVIFNKKVRAVTPGQSAVFYEGDDVIFGGIITK